MTDVELRSLRAGDIVWARAHDGGIVPVAFVALERGCIVARWCLLKPTRFFRGAAADWSLSPPAGVPRAEVDRAARHGRLR